MVKMALVSKNIFNWVLSIQFGSWLMRTENSFTNIHYLTIQYSSDTHYIWGVLNNCYPLSLK